MNILITLIILYTGICPVCKTVYEARYTQEKYDLEIFNPKTGDKNLVECKKCHAAFFVTAKVEEKP